MPFKPTLVGLSEDATGYPYLGFPVTEIQLVEPNQQGAGIPRAGAFESRDKFTEAVTGDDTKVARRKLAELEMTIDFVNADKKAEIERLQLDDRTVYFCPNMGPDTRWSFPLQRSLDDFTGRKTMANTRANDAYLWDETDLVFRVVDDDEPQFGFRGAWSRYLRTQTGQANKATKPHPDSASHGWTVAAGTPVMTYTEDILTPVLSKRIVTNGKGVVLVESPGSGVSESIVHTATGLDATDSAVASLYIAWTGNMTLLFSDNPLTAVYDTVTLLGDGTPQLIKLGGENTTGNTTGRLSLTFVDSTASESQVAIIGPVFIGSDNSTNVGAPKVLDWSEAASVSDLIQNSDSAGHMFTDITITWFGRWAENDLTFCDIGNGADRLRVLSDVVDRISLVDSSFLDANFSNLTSTFSIEYGQWLHFAITCGPSGVSLYVNGAPHPDNGLIDWNPRGFGDALVIGTDSLRSLDESGMSHLRCDAKEWTAAEVVDHYDTYFKGAGRGVIEPMFGKKLLIESLDWVPNTVSDSGAGDVHWRATIVLKELGPAEGLAAMIRQEGTP